MLSKQPASTLKLKDGLWIQDDPACTVDVASPTRQWPKCAFWAEFRNNAVIDGPEFDRNRDRMEITVLDGRPLLVEVPFSKDAGDAQVYVYVALDLVHTDTSGNVVDARAWPVACGPINEQQARHGRERPAHHFAGLDDKCQPKSIQALRAAAAAGPQGSDKKTQWRWLRSAAD